MNLNYEEMVAIAINKSIVKKYSGETTDFNVYLENGSEFQIMLFNPTTDDIIAQVYINNQKLSNTIVIRPAQRVWLERYLDIPKKFKFNTYEVEDNAQSDSLTANNGLVKVEFFKKRNRYKNTIISTYEDWTRNINRNPVYKDILLNDDSTSIKTSDYSTTWDNECSITSVTSSLQSSNNTDYTLTGLKNNMIETGRIDEGSYSSQYFYDVDIDAENTPFNTVTFKILPMSRKPYTANDLEKIYCTECGRKLKTKFKFCPYCGTKIEY